MSFDRSGAAGLSRAGFGSAAQGGRRRLPASGGAKGLSVGPFRVPPCRSKLALLIDKVLV